MKTIDTTTRIIDMSEHQQKMILEFLVENAKEYDMKMSDINDAMNSRMCDLEEVLPMYMYALDPIEYVLEQLDYEMELNGFDGVLEAWNQMCDQYGEDERKVYEMSDFNLVMEGADYSDVVRICKGCDFDVDADGYFVYSFKYGDGEIHNIQDINYSIIDYVDFPLFADYIVNVCEGCSLLPDVYPKEVYNWFHDEDDQRYA